MPDRYQSAPRPDGAALCLGRPQSPDSPDKSQTSQPIDDVSRARVPLGEPETIFVVECDDDHRDAICRILHHRGYAVEAFADCSAFLAAFRPHTPGCLLVDGLMLGVGGLDIIHLLKNEHDEFPTVVMSADASPSMVVQAMKAGAADYIEKPIRPAELLASMRRALDLSRDADGLSGFRRKAADRIAGLSPREHEILKLVLAGQSSKTIAARLGIAPRTVENHRAHIARKTGAQSLPLMVHTAICASCQLVDRSRH
jgi:two-component system, chemotaxis family, CheB/CheR fusion protein